MARFRRHRLPPSGMPRSLRYGAPIRTTLRVPDNLVTRQSQDLETTRQQGNADILSQVIRRRHGPDRSRQVRGDVEAVTAIKKGKEQFFSSIPLLA